MIEHALGWMGFRDLRPLSPFEQSRVGSISLTATPSRVDFPEMGMLFRGGGRSCWNAVDTRLDPAVVARVRRICPRIDLLLATYQPMVETELSEDGLGSPFPMGFYQELVRNALAANPRCIVPHSCGIRVRGFDWINSRRFPLNEEEFLADVRIGLPKVRTFHLLPGEVLNLRPSSPRKSRGLPFVAARKKAPARYRWAPQNGVPPLSDRDPFAIGTPALRRKIEKWLKTELPDRLQGPIGSGGLSSFFKNRVLWKLEITYPHGKSGLAIVDFGRRAVVRNSGPGARYHVQTAVTATALWGLLTGRLSPSAVVNGGMLRRSSAPYRAGARGVEPIGGIRREPMGLILFDEAWKKNLRYQMRGLC